MLRAREGLLLTLMLWCASSGADSGDPTAIRSGTGWVLAPHFIVTNQHVVGDAEEVLLIRSDDKQLIADVAVRDPVNDLALLRPRNIEDLPPGLPLANEPSRVGASVFTLGYPLLTMMGREAKMTTGYISARTGVHGDPRAYQISVPIQPGNSGGPVLNMNGEVVGVATASINIERVFRSSGALPQNVNYAIKSAYVRVLRDSAPAQAMAVADLGHDAANLEQLVERVQGSVMIVLAQDNGAIVRAALQPDGPLPAPSPSRPLDGAEGTSPGSPGTAGEAQHTGQYRLALYVYAYPSGYDRKGTVVTLDSYSADLAKLMQTTLQNRFGDSVLLVKRALAQSAHSEIYTAYHDKKRNDLCAESRASVLVTAMNDATINGLDQDITFYLYDCVLKREHLLTKRIEPRTADRFPNEVELGLVFDQFLRQVPSGLALGGH